MLVFNYRAGVTSVRFSWLLTTAVRPERDSAGNLLVFVAMLYVATERVSWLIIGGLLTAVGVYFIVQIMPHIQARFAIWLDPLSPELYAAQHGSYQIVQGWFGMASGGLFGTGLGRGYPANASQANSDMIIASFGEEVGLFGLLAMFAVYLVFTTRAEDSHRSARRLRKLARASAWPSASSASSSPAASQASFYDRPRHSLCSRRFGNAHQLDYRRPPLAHVQRRAQPYIPHRLRYPPSISMTTIAGLPDSSDTAESAENCDSSDDTAEVDDGPEASSIAIVT